MLSWLPSQGGLLLCAGGRFAGPQPVLPAASGHFLLPCLSGQDQPMAQVWVQAVLRLSGGTCLTP